METVQLIKENISVKQLADILGLRRNGKLYYCVNPMHKDDTASLSINEQSNYFKCFGCDCGSDVIDLYCYYNGLDKTNKEHFKTALKDLSNYCGIPYNPSAVSTSRADRPAISIKKPLRPAKNNSEYKFLCDYDNYYFDERAGVYEFEGGYSRNNAELLALHQVRRERLQRNKIIFNELYQYCSASGLDESIYNYLSNTRKLSDEVISKSKLFSLNDIPSTTKHLTKLFDIQELTGSGLFKNDKLLFGQSHRLIIPYIEGGEIVYLRSRYFDGSGNKAKGMKYNGLLTDCLNLNRTKRFYNLDTLNGTGLYDKVYLTEGEIDSLSLETLGLHAVAIPGTSSIPIDSEFKQFINCHVVICMDNDKPGQDATDKIETILEQLKIFYTKVILPDGIKDINEYYLQQIQKC